MKLFFINKQIDSGNTKLPLSGLGHKKLLIKILMFTLLFE